MSSFPARVTRAGSGYVIRLRADIVATLPSHGARFVVKLSNPDNPRQTLVPTMETQVKRFGADNCIVVPSVLVQGGILRARHDVLVTLLAQQL